VNDEPTPGYWFPAKRYGWGWGPPLTWQGWVFMISWLVVFFCGVGYFTAHRSLMHVVFAAAMVIVQGRATALAPGQVTDFYNGFTTASRMIGSTSSSAASLNSRSANELGIGAARASLPTSTRQAR
jgi:hypothetical protein